MADDEVGLSRRHSSFSIQAQEDLVGEIWGFCVLFDAASCFDGLVEEAAGGLVRPCSIFTITFRSIASGAVAPPRRLFLARRLGSLRIDEV